MTETLITFGTSEGHTAEIAHHIGERLSDAGLTVTVVPIDEAPEDLSRFDLVVIGASIHVGSYQDEVVRYATTHAAALAERPSAFFSVCLTSVEHTPEAEAKVKGYLDAFADATGWTPQMVGRFGGALAYTQYGFVKKRFIRGIARKGGLDTDISRDRDYTDWDDVDRFGDACRTMLTTRAAPPAEG
jgi:menaquinone-dependent protoporphyrinogen oxidase